MLLIISASVIVTNQRVEQLNKQEEIAKKIEREAGELGSLSNDYLLYHESQQRARWESKFSELSDDLSNLNPNSLEQQALVNNIRANLQRLKAVFTDVASTLESTSQNRSTLADPALLQISWSRMAIQNQGMAFDAERLAQTSRDQAHQLEHTNIILIFALLGVFGLYFLTNYFLIFRRMLKSVSELQAGTRIIGSGNFDFSFKQKNDDEIGELSRAFNRMIGNLKEANKALLAEITERARAEEQISQQASLLDKAQDAIGVRNLEHHLIYWNKGAQRMYGWTAEEAIGKNADRLLYKEELPQLIEAKKSVIQKGEWLGELRQRTKDGKEIIVESRWTLVRDNEGKPKSILIINTDITERKKLESQLLRAQRMESIGTLAGGIAHDLNNVLTPIMLSLRMLKRKSTDEQSQKLIGTLEQSTWRGANLIKQVLTFARGVEGERIPVQAAHIISEIEKIAKETFPRNIEIRNNTPKDLWTISGDATQLHQVIMNMCVNARDAMPEGGVLSISAENFLIDENYPRIHAEAKAGSYIMISISDTGAGIPPEILDRIFEPFFTTKEHGKGTGLGLSTSLAIVRSHGGFINVYSEVGTGTVFKVYLPAVKTDVQGQEEKQFELPSGKGEYILIAEDEDPIREITISMLEKCGYNVLPAADGREAVAVYTRNKDKIRVVLIDMMMPVMGGLDSIRAIRGIDPEARIIAVSGLAEKNKLEKFADIQVQAFLPKPYTAERLLRTINDVIS